MQLFKWSLFSIFIITALYYIITGFPPHIWTTPYQKLEWRYRWFIQPVVLVVHGIEKLLRNLINLLR